MGVYRSILLDLPCERCGVVRQEEAQFKTDDDWCQVYRPGDAVPDLRAGASFEACVDYYCRACHRDLVLAGSAAEHDVLARWIETGLLLLREDDSAQPLTPEFVRGFASGFQPEPGEHPLNLRPPRVLDQVEVHWSGARWRFRKKDWTQPRLPEEGEFWRALRLTVHEALELLGWPNGSASLREDVLAVVDGDGRLWLQDQEGQRLGGA